jgi:cytochrome c oxidase subunit 2
VVAFRRRPGDLADAKPIHGNTPLELAWTGVPLILVLVLGGIGTKAVLDINRPAQAQELQVEVTGFQWAWTFGYPQYENILSDELVLPVNRPVLFALQSRDVIHSFFVPEFRIKMDAIPGETNELRLTPTQIGEYRTYCAELCGTSHSYMIARVRVVDDPVFDEWVQSKQAAIAAPKDPVAEGKNLYELKGGCKSCHSVDGSAGIAPTFKGLSGRSKAVADETYLRNSILNPASQIVQGFNNLMPATFGAQLSPEEINALIAYIQSLK